MASATHVSSTCPGVRKLVEMWLHADVLLDCDAPEGQRQLEAMAQALHILSMGSTYLPSELARKCQERMEQLLTVFFVDEKTKSVHSESLARLVAFARTSADTLNSP